ncbi:serine/threonine-protein kinase PLK4 isoform X1 [Neodiprion virginianus]|uniref:serine/threonine-protein kinase PLK4 isoform X1 n=2 Tax=Neodiprion virginianus TaxID=2961670 RepID=UPI001EE7588D|nr:serine/threonine-protein kinase PLK4 isoform X1 [Neodiprion virginianus]XP_046626384.1 serine/threonine-protein kinase PLK4 isoform X1 [Neodiprion virginianus]
MPPLSGGFGEQIEDYEVLNVLGKGGFASVYRAKCLRSGMEVAIKMIDKKLMQAANMVGRVRQEVAIHSRLKHPAVLELYTFFEDANYVYLVLELCHNGELQRFLKSQSSRALPEEHASRILNQVVQGLLYLHSHQILHRDMSLSNLLLTRDMQVKIADFGLATQLTRPDEKHLTMCGTPNYISPEVATRSSHGLEADVWGLGCMLYTLLVGKPPFDTDAVKSTLTRVVMADYAFPITLSENAKDLINRLLKKNPRDRIRLRDILQHPFLALRDRNHSTKDKGSMPRGLSGVEGGDSGVGRTMSSCSHPRLRSRSEERLPNFPASLGRCPTPTPTARSEPYYDYITDVQPSYKAKPNNYSQNNNSVLTGIPQPPRSRMFSMSEQQSNYDIQWGEDNEKVDKQHRKNRERKQTEGEDEGSNKLSLSPLNSIRLQATRHRTKNAVLTILDNGEVCIEFIKRRNGKEKVSEVCRISGDGLRIVLYKASDGTSVGNEPPPLPSRGADSIHSYETLPQRHHRKYIYAARFVRLVRAKTPKLTLYTPKAKCLFMENGPHPDFELHFYNGAKITRTEGAVKVIEVPGGPTYSEDDLPPRLEEFYEHYSQSYQRCLLLESTLASLETATGHSCFPAIIGRRPATASNDALCLRGKENISQSATSTPIMPSFNASCSVVSTVASRSRRSNSVCVSTNITNTKISIPGVGVATQLSSGDVRVDYSDGSTLTVSPQSMGGGLTYESCSGTVTKYNQNYQQNSEVPSAIRDKLRHLPTIIKHLMQPKHRNIR